MNLSMKKLALTLGAYLPFFVTAADWQQPLNSITDKVIVQGYQAYANSADKLRQDVTALCGQPSEAALELAQQDFKANVLDWQEVQWLNFGPVTYFMRYYAFQYWPDKKGVTQRQLRVLSQNPETMEAPKFWNSASIAVRGLTAIESLLFHPDFSPMTSQEHCHLLEKVSLHHYESAKAVSTEWSNTQPQSWVYSEEGESFDANQVAFEQYLQQWVEHMSAVKDSKLETPIGYNSHGNLKLAEFYRSDMSLKTIQKNLQTYREIYHTGSPSLYDIALESQPEIAEQLEEQLKENVTIALQLPDNFFGEGLTKEQRIELARPLVSSISQSQSALVSLMTQLGFQIGFNSRDGD